MKLLTGGKDISELIEQIKWSGDTKQVARTIQFTIAKNKKDKDFPTVAIDEGAEIIMQALVLIVKSDVLPDVRQRHPVKIIIRQVYLVLAAAANRLILHCGGKQPAGRTATDGARVILICKQSHNIFP